MPDDSVGPNIHIDTSPGAQVIAADAVRDLHLGAFSGRVECRDEDLRWVSDVAGGLASTRSRMWIRRSP
jgi:hypothetical protein